MLEENELALLKAIQSDIVSIHFDFVKLQQEIDKLKKIWEFEKDNKTVYTNGSNCL